MKYAQTSMDGAHAAQTTEQKKRPQILIVGPAPNRKGGIAAVVASYIENWDYDQFELGYIASAIDGSGVVKLLRYLLAVVRYILRLIFWRPEIVHIHFGWGASFYRKSVLIVLARLFPVKVIIHCHTGRFDLLLERKSAIVQRYIRYAIESADLILVVSESLRAYFANTLTSKPVCLLNNAVEIPRISSVSRSSKYIVLSMGRLGKVKGTYDVLRAVPGILANVPSAEIWFGGNGDIGKVKKILSKNQLGMNVRLLGWIQGEEKHKRLSQASVFLLPSYYEGTPIAILEAMAYGLPVVSTPVGGIPQLISEGETGFLVEPGDVDAIVDKITLLYNDESLRRRIGAAGQEYIRNNFDINSNLAQLYSIYTALLNENILCADNQSPIEPQR